INMEADVRVIFFIFFLFTISSVVSETVEGLYDKSDLITCLKSNDFNQTISKSSNLWLVEFYSSWCGHCIRYAPTWKELANDIKGWHSVINIAAVDCAQEYNTKICYEHDIKAFPTIKYFKPHTKTNMNGFIIDQKFTDADTIREHILDLIERYQNSTEYKQDPPEWPVLRKLRKDEDIWKTAPKGTEFAVVIVEEKSPVSLTGRQVMLDLSQFKTLHVRRMLEDTRPDLKLQIEDYPAIFAISRQGNWKRMGEDDTERQDIVVTLKDLIGVKHTESESQRQLVHFKQKPIATSKTMGAHMQDLLSTLAYSLRQEIAHHQNIMGEHLSALKDYIVVLCKFFPGSEETINFLMKLRNWLATKEISVSGQEWLQFIDYNNDITTHTHFPTVIKWTCCQGSKPNLRGYNCGLWTLFHTLTVSAMIQQEDDENPDSREVAMAMKGYITNFFGCKECAKNFKYMAVTIEKEIHSLDDAVLWLWRSHNKANKRLHGDPSEDPVFPKIQFPSVKDCPHCRKSTIEQSDVPKWNDEEEILDFLEDFYSPEKIIMDVENYQIAKKFIKNKPNDPRRENGPNERVNPKFARHFQKERTERNPKGRKKYENDLRYLSSINTSKGWIMDGYDIGICIGFYVISAFILMLIYYHFSVNRKMRLGCPKR
ncbi:unnamed protein product, partial [Owenia fusiformis]